MPAMWGGIIAAGGSLLGGMMGADASNNAASTQAQSADNATALQREMWKDQQKNNQPFYEQGLVGMNRLSTLLGLKDGADSGSLMKDFSAADFQADPSYAWRLKQGQQALDRQASARGNMLSGGALKDAMDYNQGLASTEYGNAFNRFQAQRGAKLNALQSIAGVGQSATSQANQAAQNFGTQAGNNIIGAGNARASGYVGGANAISGGISSAINGYNQNQLMNKLFSNRSTGGATDPMAQIYRDAGISGY